MKIRKIIVLVSALLFLTISLCSGLFKISKSRSFQFFGNLTNRVETNEKIVALTFDDAPASNEQTEKVLEILNENGIKATFYLIGGSLQKNPLAGQKIAQAGHELGNHSFSHKRMVLKTPNFIQTEIEKTDALIRETGYAGEITFRPPNGKKLFTLPWYLRKHNKETIMWDIEPDSFPEVAASAEKIANYTVSNTKPGSIILMHPFCDHCSNDRDALTTIIEQLKAKGYTFVTVSEMLDHKAGK